MNCKPTHQTDIHYSVEVLWHGEYCVSQAEVTQSLQFTCPVPGELAASVFPVELDPKSHWTVGEKDKRVQSLLGEQFSLRQGQYGTQHQPHYNHYFAAFPPLAFCSCVHQI